MKTIAAAFTILFILISCSSTDKVGHGARSLSVPSHEAYQPKDKKNPANTEAAPSPVVPEVNKEEKIEAGITDDDDIVSLLENDGFKDFDLPIVFNDAVRYYVGYFTTEKKKVFANWLRRSRRYVPMIKMILKEHGLPEDLVYLAMIESGFNPKAYSSAKACGPWQFIYETGGRYGLKANFWIDERRDPEKSTIAAAKYLTDLFNQFGCWYLAAAGYNAGEKRVERAIEKHNTSDFWELAKYNALPRETREYIPKLIAASIIAKDPERFGFGGITYEEPVRFVEIKVPRATPLSMIAKASSMELTELKSLNPEILRGITPPYTDDYTIKLRASANVALVSKAVEDRSDRERKIRDVVVYKVKKKDTIAKIMKRYGVQEDEICMVNNCDGKPMVKTGMALNIPKFLDSASTHNVMVASTTIAKERSETEMVKVLKATVRLKKNAKPEKTRNRGELVQAKTKIYHIVKKGETLSGISSKYGVEMASLKSVNKLRDETVYPNMKLMLAGHQSYKKIEAPRSVRVHTVKKGETLAQIANKYRVSVATLRSTNNLKTSKVHPKMRLRIVAEG
ncbi:MAG: LysM peptidoglycan-binding domain-containing protein [Syntrophobacterales bacterium]|jgi:membrane-bound lytic murein transglycosylase D|nr:LysM peptidoglycan-binding domain-containing protein [Syntrophobacterales bacterium]